MHICIWLTIRNVTIIIWYQYLAIQLCVRRLQTRFRLATLKMGHLLISCSCKKEKQAICQKGQCNFRLELLVVHCFKMFYILCPQKLHSHFIISQGVGHRNDILRKKGLKLVKQEFLKWDTGKKYSVKSIYSTICLWSFWLTLSFLNRFCFNFFWSIGIWKLN